MRKLWALFVLFAIYPSADALADSDGYFCTGRGYIAYETRFASTAVKHELHVVRFGSAGIVAAPPVALDDFQVHGMICHDDRVELVGWNATYSIDLSNPARPVTTSRAARFEPGQIPPPENLGALSKQQIIDLDAGGGARFQLAISRASQRVGGGFEHHVVARLVQRTAPASRPLNGIVASRVLYEGVFRETID